MFNLGKLAFDLISDLIWNVIKDGLKSASIDFFQERKIKSRVEDAAAEVIKDVIPFLEQEKISLEKQQRLVETCVYELKPFAENPAELFKGSLDGQKIFDSLYHDKELPQVIIEDGLKDIYSLLFPRIATLLCKIPAAVKDWENEAWSENYRRFDEVVAQLKALFAQVDELASAPQKGADKTLNLLKRTLTQKIGLQLDITSLRADQPLAGRFDDFFVLPEIKQLIVERGREPISIDKPINCFYTFTNSNSLAIVIGAPGAGKSTWSKWLQRETLKVDWFGIGLRVEFRDLESDKLPSVYDLIRKVAGTQLAEDLTSQKIRKWLDDGHVAFILDGFDEVKPADRDKFIAWVKEIVDFGKGCPFVVTSRPLTTRHLEDLGTSWQYWNIEPFNEKRVITYVSRWFTNTPLLNDINRGVDTEKLAISWLKDPTLGPLTGNPLLLSILLMVHHLDGKLPNGRANLYKRYVDGMLGIWDDRHKLKATDIQLKPNEKRKIIRGIALHLFLAEQETIDENMLVEWLDHFLPKSGIKASATEVLAVLRERTGLIIGPGLYSFAHKTIAEYLVAETVLQGDQKDNFGKRIDRFCLLEHRKDDRWNVVLFLWAGIAPSIDVVSFIEQSIGKEYKSLAYGLLFDQYEKIPPEIRKMLLLKVRSFSGFEEKGRAWGIPGWPSGHKYEYAVPCGGLRSLSGRYEVDVEDLFIKAIEDNTISYHDIRRTRGEVRWSWYLLFCIIPTDFWSTTLKAYSNQFKASFARKSVKTTSDKKFHLFFKKEEWENLSENEWGFLVAGRVFSFWTFKDDTDLFSLFRKFNDAFPNFRGFVSFSILSSLVEYVAGSIDIKSHKLLLSKYINQVARIFSYEDVKEFNKQYLLGTRNWQFWYEVMDDNTKQVSKEKDLFLEFRRRLKMAIKLDLLEKNEDIDQIIAFVNNLKKFRDQVSRL